MRIEKKNASLERQVLTGLVTSTPMLARIYPKWHDDFFRSNWSQQIAKWCIKHYRRYGEAPGQRIENLFQIWAAGVKDEQTVDAVSRFLSSLSDEYEEASSLNVDYLIDQAKEFFETQRLLSLVDELQDELDAGELERAMQRLEKHRGIDLAPSTAVDVLNDKDALRAAFEQQSEPLISFPGPIGSFFGNELQRDAFVSFMGPEKRGKSFWLMEMAWQGVLARHRVAYFQAGDQSQNQVMLRLGSRISGIPFRWDNLKVKYPVAVTRESDEKIAIVKSRLKKFESALSWQRAWKAIEKSKRFKIRSKRPLFKLKCYPAGTCSVDDIKSNLDLWEMQSGWVPDIIVIDYADILAIPRGVDRREGTNEVWQALRALATQRHCLIVTASQTDAASYKTWVLTRSNFTEDKRKLAHVTGMIGLNQTLEEKAKGLMRLNWVVARERENDETQCVHCAECRAIARPFVQSCW